MRGLACVDTASPAIAPTVALTPAPHARERAQKIHTTLTLLARGGAARGKRAPGERPLPTMGGVAPPEPAA